MKISENMQRCLLGVCCLFILDPILSSSQRAKRSLQAGQSPIPLIRKIPIQEGSEKESSPTPSSIDDDDARILSFFKDLWNKTRRNYDNIDDFLEHIEKKSAVPLSVDTNKCSSPICHFTGRFCVIGGLSWNAEINNRLSHRFEAIASSLSDMIASLLRGIEVEVTYLDITRIMSPFKTHVNVDFDLSFNRIQKYACTESLRSAFNKGLYMGTNLGPYTLDPVGTSFLKYNHQPYKNQKIHRLKDVTKTQRSKIVFNFKHPRERFVHLAEPKTHEGSSYMLAGGVLSLTCLILFLGLGAYFQSKRSQKKRLKTLVRQDTIYTKVCRRSKTLPAPGDLSFFERIKMEDSERFLMTTEDRSGSSISGSTSLGDTSFLKFEDAHRSTLRSNRSSRASSMRKKLDSIKETEGGPHVELGKISPQGKSICPSNTPLSENELQYDIIQQL